MRCRVIAIAVACALTACVPATTQYVPQIVAQDELTLSYDGRFGVYAGERKLTQGLLYHGLAGHVRCVPLALKHGRAAEEAGARAVAFSVVGGVMGGLAPLSFISFISPDPTTRAVSLAGGLVSAVIGAVFAGLAYKQKNEANGSAVDAVNFYNDALGSYGGSCAVGGVLPIFAPPASAPASLPASAPAND
ncbi:MAG: hypothetical protein IT381_16625 [Deltaproteobacteria bacterium]|nr:hypothetical protein [Deltaproteobacteria bacterium]